MRQTFASLGRLTIIGSVAFGVATVSNFLSYHKYWNGTIFAVQTVDFNILSHTLPTKLSVVLNQESKDEIQSTLNSNYGLFGMVVTDCQTAEIDCPSQRILYSSESSRTWQQQLQVNDLPNHPYDVLRDPPPIYAEGRFANTRDWKRQPTGQTNSGAIIGRVYYVRGVPPTFMKDYTRWMQNPFMLTGANAIYTLTLILYMLGGFCSWRVLERVIRQKKIQQELAQQERKQLLEKQEQLLQQAQYLQQQLQEKIQQIPVLLNQREQARAELELYQEEQEQHTHQLEQKIAQYETQLTEQEEQRRDSTQTLKRLQQELADFQQREVTALQEIQQREQAITALRQLSAKQEREQQEKAQTLERLQQESTVAQQWQIEAQSELQQRERAIANLKHLIVTQEQEQQENTNTLEQLQRELTEVQQRHATAYKNLEQSQHAIANLRCQIDMQEEEKQEKVGVLLVLRQDLQNTKARESEARCQAEKLSQMITALTFERDQALQKFHELEQFHRVAAPNVDKLSAALKAASTELEQLKEIEKYALEDNDQLRSENNSLKSEKEQLRQKYDDAQLQIWALEEQVEFYLKYLAKSREEQSRERAAAGFFNPDFETVLETTDLSGLRLALVGGHSDTRREVIRELSENYRLQDYVEIAPSSEAYLSRSSVKARIGNCDLIVVITGYMGHDLSRIVSELQRDGALNGQVLLLACRGKSGVVREIINHAKAKVCQKELIANTK